MKIIKTDFVAGAQKAKGIAVIIDVFRAFSVACYCINRGANHIYPVGAIDDAKSLATDLGNTLLIGERHGKKVPGFDLGNSPTEVLATEINGKDIVHTTHAGTQGLVNAINANEVITGALVNAKAIATYIKQQAPEEVTLVRMGWEANTASDEDNICADYLEALITETPFDESAIYPFLKSSPFAERFFDESQPWNPVSDFEHCLALNKFNFILRAEKNASNLLSLNKIDV